MTGLTDLDHLRYSERRYTVGALYSATCGWHWALCRKFSAACSNRRCSAQGAARRARVTARFARLSARFAQLTKRPARVSAWFVKCSVQLARITARFAQDSASSAVAGVRFARRLTWVAGAHAGFALGDEAGMGARNEDRRSRWVGGRFSRTAHRRHRLLTVFPPAEFNEHAVDFFRIDRACRVAHRRDEPAEAQV